MTASSQNYFFQSEEPPLPQQSSFTGQDKINQLTAKTENHSTTGSFLFAEKRKNAR